MSEPDRLTRLEAMVEALASDVASLAKTVRDRSGVNWNAVGFVATLLGAVYLTLATQVSTNRESIVQNAEASVRYADQRYNDNRNLLNETRDQLHRLIDRETMRNNILEREMGAVQMINNLFMQGKLKLNGDSHK